eukprot:5545031-Heterocapsa_arctica.AAC.1
MEARAAGPEVRLRGARAPLASSAWLTRATASWLPHRQCGLPREEGRRRIRIQEMSQGGVYMARSGDPTDNLM